MLLTWVPSKKAMAAGLVPTDYQKYDIDTSQYEADPDALARIMESVEVAATRTVRHAFNNEAASSWLAKLKADDAPEDTPENRAVFLDNWRNAWREAFIEGKLGLRRVAVTVPKDELTTEMESITLNILREFAEKQNVPFTYNVVNARTLAAPYGDSGKTIGEVMADLMDPEKSPKRAAKIRAEAQKILDQRAAAKAALADDDGDDELSAIFEDLTDEEEAEQIAKENAAAD